MNTPLDIGPHFPASDLSGRNFFDSDGDTIPDYVEDENGNGLVDASEFSFLSDDTNGDGISDDEAASAPYVLLENSGPSTTSVGLLQLRGRIQKRVIKVVYEVKNSAGEVVSQGEGFKEDQVISPNRPIPSGGGFICPDVKLIEGVNQIKVTVTDSLNKTGSASIVKTYDPIHGDPPEIAIEWPLPESIIASDTVNVVAQSSDPTLVVVATVTAADNSTTSTSLMDRKGKVWLDNLRLGPGQNDVALDFQTVGGTSLATAHVLVYRSPATITINDIADGDLYKSKVTVTGTIDQSGYTISVNNHQATVNGDGTWTVADVPLPDDTSATISVVAVDNTTSTPSVMTRTFDKTVQIIPVSYESIVEYATEVRPCLYYKNDTVNSTNVYHWRYRQGGTNTLQEKLFADVWTGQNCDDEPFNYLYSLLYEGELYLPNFHTRQLVPDQWWDIPVVLENASRSMVDSNNAEKPPMRAFVRRVATTSLKLYVGGRGTVGQQVLVRIPISVTSSRFSDYPDEFFDWNFNSSYPLTSEPVPNEKIRVLGEQPGSDGAVYKMLPIGIMLDVTPDILP